MADFTFRYEGASLRIICFLSWWKGYFCTQAIGGFVPQVCLILALLHSSTNETFIFETSSAERYNFPPLEYTSLNITTVSIYPWLGRRLKGQDRSELRNLSSNDEPTSQS